VLERIHRDMYSGLVASHLPRHSTLFIDGAAHRGGYDPTTLPAALETQLP
jgi:hypothetical protein